MAERRLQSWQMIHTSKYSAAVEMLTLQSRAARLALPFLTCVAVTSICAILTADAQEVSVGSVRSRTTASAETRAGQRGALLFVGLGLGQTTLIFDAQNRQIGSIPAPTGSFAFDSEQNFYDVPNNSDVLLIFAPPYNKVPVTIGYGRDTAEALAVDSKTGVVAVALEAYANGGPGPLYIEFYRRASHGVPTPCATIQASSAALLAGGAFDRDGTLFFVEYANNGYNGVASVAGQCKPRAVTFNYLPSGLNAPQGILEINGSNQLVLQDLDVIYTFAHPRNGQLGQPISETHVKPPHKEQGGIPSLSCLAGDGVHFWATFQDGRTTTPLYKFNYPAGGLPSQAIAVKRGFACAVTPPLVPSARYKQ